MVSTFGIKFPELNFSLLNKRAYLIYWLQKKQEQILTSPLFSSDNFFIIV